MLDNRLLYSFLAVAEEENITKAAKKLHISEPALSKQISSLEAHLGCQFFLRTNKKTTLTEEGLVLQARAREMLDLSTKIEEEFLLADSKISGDVFVGCIESDIMRLFTKSINKTRETNPDINISLYSGNPDFINDYLDKGLIDFGIELEPVKQAKFNYELLNYYDTFGILMKSDSPYSNLSRINIRDVFHLPLIVAQQKINTVVEAIQNYNTEKLNIVGKYNLINNAVYMVEEGLGYAFCLKDQVNAEGRNLVFVPVVPEIKLSSWIVTKKHTILSKPARLVLNNFLEELNNKADA